MTAQDKLRLKRLHRLERMRAIAKQTAAAEAAAAESTLAKLTGLSEHTRRLTLEYSARREASDGGDLHALLGFLGGLTDLDRTTSSDTRRARSIADAKLLELAGAERRRAAVEDRAKRELQTLARAENLPAAGARRKVGTNLD
ncbi:MAG TPA: hypothetical protein VJM34_04895 [Novosphingobium sp.]|nr:hypothetical protein [Novosphingobium sp.]